MARTLLCLLVSMTAGAAVLDWFEPTRLAAQASPTELIALGKAADQSWRAIRIDPYRAGGDPGAGASHFIVGRDGSLSVTESWRSQRHLSTEGVVRIGLQASPNSNELTPAQWAATTELLQRLRRACRIPRRQILVDDTIAAPPPPAPSTPTGRPEPRVSPFVP